jgi:hypothetical protein
MGHEHAELSHEVLTRPGIDSEGRAELTQRLRSERDLDVDAVGP